MELKDIDFLTKTEFYPVMSDRTGKYYMSRTGGAFLYEAKPEGETFAKKQDKASLGEKKLFDRRELLEGLYSMGFSHINVKMRGKDAVRYDIEDKNVPLKNYNVKTRRTVTLIRQTHLIAHLKELKDEAFYIPVRPLPREYGEYQEIEYCTARERDKNEKYYVCFTSAGELIAWAKTQKAPWSPVETSLTKMKRIRKDSGIIINPATDRLILTEKELKL